MRDDAARVLQAEDDYEYLRARANAELHAVPGKRRRRPSGASRRRRRRLLAGPEPGPSRRSRPWREAPPAPARALALRDAPPTRPRAVESPERGRPVSGVEGRRTIEITGQAAPSRRRSVTPSPTVAARPDRIALWGFLLGMFLVLMAVSHRERRGLSAPTARAQVLFAR